MVTIARDLGALLLLFCIIIYDTRHCTNMYDYDLHVWQPLPAPNPDGDMT